MEESSREKEEFFCQEFIKDLNATQAFKRVHTKAKLTTCRTESSRLLAKPNIRSRINALILERSKKNEIEASDVLKELYRIAMVDIIEIFDDEGRIKPISEIHKDVRKAIAGVEVVEYYEGHGEGKAQVGWIKKIKMWDKNKSLENLGRHLKLFTDNVEIEGNPFASLSNEEIDKKIDAFIKTLSKSSVDTKSKAKKKKNGSTRKS